jgi:hypothetical protein
MREVQPETDLLIIAFRPVASGVGSVFGAAADAFMFHPRIQRHYS